MSDMSDTLDPESFRARLRAGARAVAAWRDELCRLDSFGGDGDHGATMERAAARIEETLDGADRAGDGDFSALLEAIGWAVLGCDGGAMGTLLGLFFTGAGGAIEKDAPLGAAALAGALEAGLEATLARTKARAGDKTMVDALAPAVEAARRAAEEGAGIEALLARAAEAAEAGAESTRGLVARFGRAKQARERGVGHPDPGATTVALLFRGFQEGAR